MKNVLLKRIVLCSGPGCKFMNCKKSKLNRRRLGSLSVVKYLTKIK